MESVTFEKFAFFKLVMKAGTFSEHDPLQIKAERPTFEVGPRRPVQRRKLGLFLFKDGMEELVQL